MNGFITKTRKLNQIVLNCKVLAEVVAAMEDYLAIVIMIFKSKTTIKVNSKFKSNKKVKNKKF